MASEPPRKRTRLADDDNHSEEYQATTGQISALSPIPHHIQQGMQLASNETYSYYFNRGFAQCLLDAGKVGREDKVTPPEGQSVVLYSARETTGKICARCHARIIKSCSGHYPCDCCRKDGARCQLVRCVFDPCKFAPNCRLVHIEDCHDIQRKLGGSAMDIYQSPENGEQKIMPGAGLPFDPNNNRFGYVGDRPEWMTNLWFPESLPELVPRSNNEQIGSGLLSLI